MCYTQLTNKYNNHSGDQLSSDSHQLKTPTVFDMYFKMTRPSVVGFVGGTSFQLILRTKCLFLDFWVTSIDERT